jgi:microcystin synthetase protein McyJ
MNQENTIVTHRPSRLRIYWEVTKKLTEFVGFVIKPNTAKLYDNIGDDITGFGGKDFQNLNRPLWLNEGFWKEANTYPQACEALATLVGDAAALSPEDTVLDLGFGFGDQDLFWVEKYNVKKITGINISPLQVEIARKRIGMYHLQDRIEVMLGTATKIPFPDNSFSKVIAMECALHFNTREKFFKEAFRVLQPGGKLVTTDMLPLPGNVPRDFWKKVRLRSMSVTERNMYDRNKYIDKLENLNFINTSKNSIRNYVFPGMAKYRNLRLMEGKKMEEVVVALSPEEIEKCEGVQIWENAYGINDYVLFTAEKPMVRVKFF